MNGDHPATTVALADAVARQGNNETYLFAHSFVGGTLFGSSYLDNKTPQHLPGAAQGEFWRAVKGVKPVFDGSVNPHSCYGLNCAGTPYNWTEQNAAGYKNKRVSPVQGGGHEAWDLRSVVSATAGRMRN
ncbi:MAG TPA: hypothetical protein VM687_08285 [Stenotrophomonas sp.]|nr:hypothetical protein [Stenotrophomonas sp.]